MPGFRVAAFPMPGFPAAAFPMPDLPVAGISVAALRLAGVREALVSAAGAQSITAAATAQPGPAPTPGPATAVGADMATTAPLPLALLPVTPMAGPPVARLMPTTTRAAIGPNATRRARAGANAWSTSANDLPASDSPPMPISCAKAIGAKGRSPSSPTTRHRRSNICSTSISTPAPHSAIRVRRFNRRRRRIAGKTVGADWKLDSPWLTETLV
jgi:hypothetical protein